MQTLSLIADQASRRIQVSSQHSKHPLAARWKRGWLAGCIGLATLILPRGLCAAPDLFARFTADRDGIVAGEQFTLTLTIYSANDSLGQQITVSGLPPPEQLALTPFQELAIGTATVDGRAFATRPFRCRARVSAPGTVVVAPSLQGILEQMVRSYFFVQRSQQPVHIPVEPLNLNVLSVPDAGRPVDFSGAVGRFSFRAEASPRDVAVGDLVTVTLTIQGEGLPDALTPPVVPAAPGFKVYGIERVPEQCSDTAQVFRQTVVPLDGDARLIPALAFSFFDARSRRYVTQTAGPFPLTFHAERGPAQTIYQPVTAAQSSAASTPPTSPPPPPGWVQRMQRRFVTGDQVTLTGTGEVTVRFAPSETARPLFTLKPGAPVHVLSSTDGWLRISGHDGIGWIPEDTIFSNRLTTLP